MNAFELLKQDHEKVSGLFKQIEAATEGIKTELFAQLKNELDVHAHIEETIFYPVLQNAGETREITLEAYEEHKVVKDLLTELASYTTPNDEWDAKLTVLKENVEHHVEEEEGEMFDKAEDVLSQDQIEQLGNQMYAEKQRFMGETSRAGGAAKSRRAVGQSRSSTSSRPSSQEGTRILGSLANLVGLGSSPRKSGKKASRKTASSKRATKSSASRKRQAAKSTTKRASSKRATKQSRKATAKRATKKTATRRTKRATVSSRTSALKTSRSAGTKKGRTTQKKSRKK